MEVIPLLGEQDNFSTLQRHFENFIDVMGILEMVGNCHRFQINGAPLLNIISLISNFS